MPRQPEETSRMGFAGDQDPGSWGVTSPGAKQAMRDASLTFMADNFRRQRTRGLGNGTTSGRVRRNTRREEMSESDGGSGGSVGGSNFSIESRRRMESRRKSQKGEVGIPSWGCSDGDGQSGFPVLNDRTT